MFSLFTVILMASNEKYIIRHVIIPETSKNPNVCFSDLFMFSSFLSKLCNYALFQTSSLAILIISFFYIFFHIILFLGVFVVTVQPMAELLWDFKGSSDEP